MSPHCVPNATYVHRHVFPDAGSRPRVCDFDDRVLRLVKWHPSTHGETSTYSELIASRLGQLIEAPLMRGTIVYVEPGLLPPELATRINQPFHVGFTYSPGKNFVAEHYDLIENRDSLPAAAVHLAWLCIGDHEFHNQYLYQLERILPDKSVERLTEFMLIDQAAVHRSHDWRASGFGFPDETYELPLHLRAQLAFDNVVPVIDNLRGIEEDEILACLHCFPEEWGIPAAPIELLGKYLLARRPHLADILKASLP